MDIHMRPCRRRVKPRVSEHPQDVQRSASSACWTGQNNCDIKHSLNTRLFHSVSLSASLETWRQAPPFRENHCGLLPRIESSTHQIYTQMVFFQIHTIFNKSLDWMQLCSQELDSVPNRDESIISCDPPTPSNHGHSESAGQSLARIQLLVLYLRHAGSRVVCHIGVKYICLFLFQSELLYKYISLPFLFLCLHSFWSSLV